VETSEIYGEKMTAQYGAITVTDRGYLVIINLLILGLFNYTYSTAQS
jgi:hypothetical protein